ncbi:MAG: 2-C-methyl-D-erythritol 4-phosphate cytidylyltransferase [Candidatus Nitrohelix vancouverensis]|uniref:2-C-methyl-D-erythritol 4-phosphate cytidylyltransferase n=1 Tax=Candidatus Nitrohelix vancouverensis TaxID=2705534 RepID=A0A7T0G226_9BACT|nr:MAG: 2-C-methyl-D-erythritol 4-phosphate cytidylyltransferase [Candidatus Nitrohelix vancouverensis]
MKVAAIIPAGGQGVRMGGTQAKQYLTLGDKPILRHTLEVFQSCGLIDSVILSIPEADVVSVRREYLPDFMVLSAVVAGGAQRQDSVFNGFQAVDASAELIVVHDGVRPFATREMIESVIRSAEQHGAAIVAVPLSDTLKRADAEGRVKETIPRENLWRVQTPQAFRRDVLERAFQKAQEDSFYGTDEASLVERLGLPVAIVTGSEMNIKVTRPEDLIIGEGILASRAE